MNRTLVTRTLVTRISAALLFLTLGWIAYTQLAYTQNPAPAKLTLNKVKDDLYEIEGDGGNVAVYITDEGVILIDDKFDQDHQGIVDHVKSVTNQPIKYIINTHYHQDHSGGNAKFLPTAEIISTAMARTNILEHKQSTVQPPAVSPARITFTTEADVNLGGKEVRAIYMGRGHTNGDAVIYFPALRVLHTGDLMAGASPLIDYNGGGSVVEWTKTLDNALKLDFDTVIPGHGAITNKAGLMTYRDNVEKMRTRVSGLIHEGKGQAEVAKFMETEYKWAPNSLQQQWSVPGMIAELK
jgi:cyclase